ncbi:sigma-54-dependent Fis family transcriptional regulator [Lampropedia puyangensis]|uniref:Sigma-54-dependent Fis family transcriptional regulator n=1 Tax=Lampropedia puyangensis TaxID=1330072 RepID=A0A4S8EWA3_9BURK|nr:sigma-54-dependent Fis family transcriptional regulator [Lampropedia puyangensis]THT99247.1 sigma-54-dependent Fis family transcriptional regulator [Lampropedia puyangensis]
MTQATPNLQQARRQWLENGQSIAGVLDERLAQSWRRSAQAGVQPHDTRDVPDPIQGAHLNDVLDSNAQLLAHAKPVMDFIYQQIRGSHSMVVLADAHSTLLHTQGDRGFLNKAQRVALSQGACWKEDSRGTNAIGTALFERIPVRVRGGEHFLEQNAFLHCAAAPVFTAQGDIAGVIDISGEPMVSQSHTLGMASMAARMIENSWLKAAYPQYPRVHVHPRPEGLGTAAEGILIMTHDGVLVGANHAAMQMLRLSSTDFFSSSLEQRLQQRMQQFLLRADSAAVAALRLPSGQRLYVRAHASTPTVLAASVGSASSSVSVDDGMELPVANSPVTRADASDDALARLDVGDAQWHSAIAKVRRIINSPVPLLIQGESGVGKEVFARAAHDSGPRSGKPFVAINCAAIPESLIEAELFGYAPGAYTGALRSGSLGRIREAHGGTLFLDEIGDMPLGLQTRLLRVLQERTVTPLGGDSVEVDFALISATHCPLQDAIAQGRFRTDLYYRINGFSVKLPALRERSDMAALVVQMLKLHGAGQQVVIAPALWEAMRRYVWPGNLRQLANTVQTACSLLQAGETEVSWHHLADDVQQALLAVAESQNQAGHGAAAGLQSQTSGLMEDRGAVEEVAARSLKQQTLQAIVNAMADCGGNVSHVAKHLGISRQTIYRYLRKAQLQ